jgi:trehalose-phosphatase
VNSPRLKRFDRSTRVHLVRLAGAESLLVVSDFDGTLAPIVDRPEKARALPRAARALADLSRLERTHAAIVSGRDRSTLLDLWDASGAVRAMIEFRGSYGSEGEGTRISADRRRALDELQAGLEAVASRVLRAFVERKAFSVALHVRLALMSVERGDQSGAAHAISLARSIVRRIDPAGGILRAHEGRGVIEWSALQGGKADALRAIRLRVRPTRTLIIGDDEADVSMLEVLGGGDLALLVGAVSASAVSHGPVCVRTGSGADAAARVDVPEIVHVPDPIAASRMLDALARFRRRARG